MIPTDIVVPGGAVGLLGLVVWMILTGWLVPRRTVRQVEQDRDYWRQIALKSVGQKDKLMVGAEVATEVLRALPDVAAERAAARAGEPA